MSSLTPSLFRREGEHWLLAFAGATCRLDDTRGMQYLARLLRHPGQEVHVLALVTEAVDSPALESASLDAPERDASVAQQARVNITRTIKAALRKITGHHPALGQHLAHTVKTGIHCSYTPDPRLPITWQS